MSHGTARARGAAGSKSNEDRLCESSCVFWSLSLAAESALKSSTAPAIDPLCDTDSPKCSSTVGADEGCWVVF